jgi:hypothetical protein
MQTLKEALQIESILECAEQQLTDTPISTDLWLARDFCNKYDEKTIVQFLTMFLRSGSSYLAITSHEYEDSYKPRTIGPLRPLNLLRAPFELPDPFLKLADGRQWFRNKYLFVYKREAILEWVSTKTEADLADTELDTSDTQKHQHLSTNVPLRQLSLYDHMG